MAGMPLIDPKRGLTMTKAEWGAKRLCPKCATRFYDLTQDPATCPNCDNVFEISTLYQSDIRASNVKEAEKAKAATPDDILDEDVDLVEDDADISDELLEDDDSDTVSLDEIADVATNDDE